MKIHTRESIGSIDVYFLSLYVITPSATMAPSRRRSKTTDWFVWNSRRKCFCARENPLAERSRLIPLKGAIPTLRRLFYPTYSYESANLVTAFSQKSSSPQSSEVEAKHRNAYNKKDRRLRGTKLGLLIVKQLETTVGWFQKLNCDPRAFFDPSIRVAASRNITDVKTRTKFTSNVKNLHSYTEKIWSVLHKLHLIPIETERIVGSIEHGVGTAVDLVCRDTVTGKIVLIEIKTNYKFKDRCTSLPMRFPFQHLTDSPLHQHYLQLLLTYDLYMRTPGTDKNVSDVLLVRVDEKGVDVDRLPGDMIMQYRDTMMKCIYNNSIRTSSSSSKPQPKSKPKAKAKAKAKTKTKPISSSRSQCAVARITRQK